jgi:hypothetical protein
MRNGRILAAAAMLAVVPAGLAQEGLGLGTQDQAAPKELPRPPIARRADPNPPTLWNMGALVLIIALVFGANMIPSKRGHQD